MDVYLEKLELYGFKSFPEKTVIKFHKGITAVVGPNGCGKSNIVDAILWVLGEQRIKNLRGENNEDLIFNGSGLKKPLGMTEVGSYFINQGKPVYLSRRFFRSGESKYILNEKYCRNKDIQDALYEMQIGERKYFIFEQGSIDRLISLKPSEKRSLIEEAAGISLYLERKKETTNKLIIAEQNLENIQILVTDKMIRLKELKNQVHYVKRFRQFKNDRNNFLKAMLKKKYQVLQKDFNQYKSEIEKIINQETIFIKEVSALEKQDIHSQEKMWLIDRNLKQFQQEIFETNRDILTTKNEIEKSFQKNDFNKQKIDEKKESIHNYQTELASIQKLLQKENDKIMHIEIELKSEKENQSENKKELSALKEKITNLKTQESGLGTTLFQLQSENAQIHNKIMDIENNNNRLQNEMTSKINFIQELKNQVSVQEIQKLQIEQEKLIKKIESEESLFQRSLLKEKEISKIIETMETEMRNIANESITLENQQKKYMEIKKKIIGVEEKIPEKPDAEFLHDVIVTKKENHKIIENFYYEELDAILLKSEKDITESRINKFLIPKGNRSDLPPEVEAESGFIASIKDLFSVNDDKIIGYIKNGVLVDNIKNGIKINLKYDVDIVTQNAEIINKDGLLIKRREKGILDVIDEIRDIESKKEVFQKKSAKLEKVLIQVKEKAQEIKNKLEKQQKELTSFKENEIQLNTRLNELKKNKEIYLQRVKANESETELLTIEKDKNETELKKYKEYKEEINKNIQKKEKENTELKENIRQIDEKIIQIEKTILQKESSLNIFNEKFLSIKNKINELETSQTKNSRLIEINQQEIMSLEKNIKETNIEINDLKKNIQTLDKRKEYLENQIKNQEKEFEEINDEIKNIAKNLSQKRKFIGEIKENRSKEEINLASTKKDLFQLEESAFKELNCELNQIEEPENLKDTSLQELENEFNSNNEKMNRMRDSDRLNFSAESEYEILDKDFNFLLSQKKDIENSIQDMNDAIKKIDEESQVSFLKAYNEIKNNYQKNFKILFDGGEAELWLTDEANITESGLEIKAQPPGKKLQSLRLLSGGEKALTSLAFLFALFEYKPSPFCVFDEVDAALDEANIKRFLKFVHKLKEKTQFLIITHNFKTMEEADYIYGITMNEPGISTIYSMKMTGKDQLISET